MREFTVDFVCRYTWDYLNIEQSIEKVHTSTINIKREGHSEKLTFFVFAYSKLTFIFSTYRCFSLWSASYPAEIRLKRSGFGGRHFETVLATRPCLCDVIPSDSKLAGRRKTCNWPNILHKVSKIYFFQVIIHFTNFNAIISEFGACLAQNNIAQEQP